MVVKNESPFINIAKTLLTFSNVIWKLMAGSRNVYNIIRSSAKKEQRANQEKNVVRAVSLHTRILDKKGHDSG